MKNTFTTKHLLAYLSGSFPKGKVAAFRQELANNPQLAQELAELKQLSAKINEALPQKPEPSQNCLEGIMAYATAELTLKGINCEVAL